MANTINSFETEHQGLINDSQFDYYGKRLATAGSDGKITIFDIVNESPKKVGEIFGTGHENSIWQVTWSHPRFGPLLASCGFDKKAIIWKENSPNIWVKLFEYQEHSSSVNTIAFAPQEYGLILLCGSTDGCISVHEYKNENWQSHKFFGHGFGVNGVSWGPVPDESVSSQIPPLRFASCGNDNLVKVWQAKDNRNDSFYVLTTLEGHEDVVRDVVWCNNKSFNYDVIASGGDDEVVYLWINSNSGVSNINSEYEYNSSSNNASDWKKYELRRFPTSISKLSWDENGHHLLVAASDGVVYLFKEGQETQWDLVSMTNPEGVMESVSSDA